MTRHCEKSGAFCRPVCLSCMVPPGRPPSTIDYSQIALAILREHNAGELHRRLDEGRKGEPCPLPGLNDAEAAELGRLRDEVMKRKPLTSKQQGGEGR